MKKSVMIGSIALTGALLLGGWVAKAENTDEEASWDHRKTIVFSDTERAAGLRYMRNTLSAIQDILANAADENMDGVAKAARSMSTPIDRLFRPETIEKMNPQFRLLLKSMPKNFERIAADAESAQDPRLSVLQVSQMMARCLNCHDKYRAVEE